MSNLNQSRNQPLRIGLFGGTFNPIHIGHTQAALDVVRRFNLGQIYFIPCAQPPHKTVAMLAPAADRYAMVCLALADHPMLSACDVEIQRAGPSFTIDTVRHFKAVLPKGGELYFILGLDAFLEVNTWKAFDRLFEEAAFIVMARPHSGQPGHSLRQTVETFVKNHIGPNYTVAQEGRCLVHPHKPAIHLAPVTPVDISASQIRRMIRQGHSIAAWVAPAVGDYIDQKGLYR